MLQQKWRQSPVEIALSTTMAPRRWLVVATLNNETTDRARVESTIDIANRSNVSVGGADMQRCDEQQLKRRFLHLMQWVSCSFEILLFALRRAFEQVPLQLIWRALYSYNSHLSLAEQLVKFLMIDRGEREAVLPCHFSLKSEEFEMFVGICRIMFGGDSALSIAFFY